MRVGIDNYGLLPLGLNAGEILSWAEANHAEGVQFSGLSAEERKSVDVAWLKDLAAAAADKGLYLEWGGGQHIPMDMQTWGPKDIAASNRRAAEEAAVLGTQIVRSCSGGLMRWQEDSPSTEIFLKHTAAALKEQRTMFQDSGVILAIETHFEFTTFELLRLFEMCEAEPGEYLGICLDTMNLLTMLEEPLAATRRALPWVVATHIKDGGILLEPEGLVTFPAAIGRGIIDLKAIICLLRSLPREVHLSIEDHGGSFELPVFDDAFRAKFPDIVLKEYLELGRLSHIARKRVDNGELEITDREDWPAACESRLRQDIRELRKIVEDSGD